VFKKVFTKPGTYSYTCEMHPFMSGKIVVDWPARPDPARSASGAGAADARRDHSRKFWAWSVTRGRRRGSAACDTAGKILHAMATDPMTLITFVIAAALTISGRHPPAPADAGDALRRDRRLAAGEPRPDGIERSAEAQDGRRDRAGGDAAPGDSPRRSGPPPRRQRVRRRGALRPARRPRDQARPERRAARS
jgi:hypothetical protein